jgi:signal peptidase II
MMEDAAPKPAPSQSRKYVIFGVVFALALIADQVTKIWARDTLQPRRAPIVVIDGFFDLRYSENPGSAFGLFRNVAGGRWLLLGIGAVAMVVVIGLLRRAKPDQLRVAAELGLLAGGALGNIIDRVSRGVVTDFVLWKIQSRGLEWPVFNVADAALVVGVIALLFDMKGEPKEPEAAPAEGARRKRKK